MRITIRVANEFHKKYPTRNKYNVKESSQVKCYFMFSKTSNLKGVRNEVVQVEYKLRFIV